MLATTFLPVATFVTTITQALTYSTSSIENTVGPLQEISGAGANGMCGRLRRHRCRRMICRNFWRGGGIRFEVSILLNQVYGLQGAYLACIGGGYSIIYL